MSLKGVFADSGSWKLPIVVAFLIVGCSTLGLGVKIRVEPLVAETYPPHSKDFPIQPLDSKPARPYVKIAKLIATTQSDDEEEVRLKILKKARPLGADAVIMGKADVLKHMGHPRYQSTLTPEVRYSIMTGGPGSGIPLFFDPWTYVQTASDGTVWTLYLSGTAIRYVSSSKTAERFPDTKRIDSYTGFVLSPEFPDFS